MPESPINRTFGILGLAALLIIGCSVFIARGGSEAAPKQAAAVALSETHGTVATSTDLEPTTTAAETQTAVKSSNKAKNTDASAASSTGSTVERLPDPYPTPPLPFSAINADARAALVNIQCYATGATPLHSISGSGIIVDSRGVILTNAHIAQYVLLSEVPEFNLNCVVRAGAPARPLYHARVLYMPASWVEKHASEITEAQPVGTGEHDYAFLAITSAESGILPASFPALSPDSRDAIAFPGDSALIASYPAELVGAFAAQNDLFPMTTVAPIRALMTFATSSVDTLALGGVIEAQGGSSGGAIVNAWDRIIGLITTTSEASTTADRDLHAVTTSYIDRDLRDATGQSIDQFLDRPLANIEHAFDASLAPTIIQKYVTVLSK